MQPQATFAHDSAMLAAFEEMHWSYEMSLVDHYATGPILDRIKSGLKAAGANPDAPKPSDLKAVDEFHTGGFEATEAFLDPLGITPEHSVLDVGSGIGGTARFMAERYGAYVHGIDLTPAFVETANTLSDMVGLAHKTSFFAGSAMEMPFEDESFDLATMMHVGMNVADKPALFAEVAKKLRPGGRFALFDIMATGEGEILFPVPWSSRAEDSFVAHPDVYRAAGASAGLELVGEKDRGDYARDFFERVTAASAEAEAPPPMGLHLLMGDEAQARYGNAVAAALSGATRPWEMIFEKPS